MKIKLIQKHNSNWSIDFEKIKSILITSLDALEIRIEHVGSTSVLGLAAKPIIDIDIVYLPGVSFLEVKAVLENLNYFHNGDQGIPNREVFKRVEEDPRDGVLDEIDHHLYVCPADSIELGRHLLFRNHLRKNEVARAQYQKIKMEIAEEANQDRKKYAAIKEVKLRAFIEKKIEEEKLSLE